MCGGPTSAQTYITTIHVFAGASLLVRILISTTAAAHICNLVGHALPPSSSASDNIIPHRQHSLVISWSARCCPNPRPRALRLRVPPCSLVQLLLCCCHVAAAFPGCMQLAFGILQKCPKLLIRLVAGIVLVAWAIRPGSCTSGSSKGGVHRWHRTHGRDAMRAFEGV